jgi:hypothetical protein
LNRFKHSGTFGDLIYSLPIVKHFGGGEFYLHLDQINWIGQYYYGSQPDPFHRGRMNEKDFQYLKPFLEQQSYITKFAQLDRDVEITHNLDRFRAAFVHHPGNYIDCYADVFGINDKETKQQLKYQPWLTVDDPVKIPGRPTVINRTSRWIPADLNPQWHQWRDQGLANRSIFVGLEQEHQEFVRITGIDCEYVKTESMLDMARLIAGADQFIGNQSMALSLAIGLGVKTYCEYRRDLPLERNECGGFNPEQVTYF